MSRGILCILPGQTCIFTCNISYFCRIILIIKMKFTSLSKLLLLLICSSIICISCKRNDDEPVRELAGISRLYVSYSDYEVNTTREPYPSLAIYSTADSSTLATPLFYRSGAQGGAAIYFTPAYGQLMQSSVNNPSYVDTALQVLTISREGSPASGFFFSNGILANIRGIAMDVREGRRHLYLSNNASPSRIYMYNNPAAVRGFRRPTQTILLGENIRPWTIQMHNTDLLATLTGDNSQFAVFGNLAAKNTVDSTFTADAPKIFTINGANNLQGFHYSESLNLLAMTDWSDANEGKIYIFENANNLLNGASTVLVPTRVITGPETGLINPVDVKLDGRANTDFLYVADRGARKIFRFKWSDNGNVAPQIAKEERSIGRVLTPVGISLDARGTFK